MGGAPSQETEERRHEPETRLSLYSARRHDLLHHRGRAQGLAASSRPCRSRSSACSSARSFCCPSPCAACGGTPFASPAPTGATFALLGFLTVTLHMSLLQMAVLHMDASATSIIYSGNPVFGPRRRAPDPARAAETEPPHCHRRRADRHSLHPQPREARGQSARLRGDPHGDRSLRHVRHTLQAAHPAARRAGHHDL